MRLIGRTTVPGDKSISHRALLISSISQGKSVIVGMNRGADCAQTLSCLQQLGVPIFLEGETWVVHGQGFRLRQAQGKLDCGNSGTTLRLLAGILAGQDFSSILDGDASLRSRPMLRIMEPLRGMGAELCGVDGSSGAPIEIRGGYLRGIRYELPVASAQVKSAILLAGLQASGITTVLEPTACRDHTERMLQSVGADLQVHKGEIKLTGKRTLEGRHYEIPGDLSSAAFLLGAAVALPGSELIIENLGLNPTRLGFLEVLEAMGASVEIVDFKIDGGGEPVGTILARGGELKGAVISGDLIPRVVDEIPILAVLATQAHGTTVIKDAEELRVKESDRLASLARELTNLGAKVQELPAGLEITGPTKLKGGVVQSYGDHRLALAFEVAALFSEDRVKIQGGEVSKISFPGFQKTWGELIRG